MRSRMTQTNCTCWISLVVRVMREAVEKFSISALEKPMTLEKVSRRRSRPMAADTREARKPTATATTTISRVRASIWPPTRKRYCICTFRATPCASYSSCTSSRDWLFRFSSRVLSSWFMALSSCFCSILRSKPGIWLMAANWLHTVSRSAAVGVMVSVSVSAAAEGISARPVMPMLFCPAGVLAACAAAIYSTMSGVVTASSSAVRSSSVRSERSCNTPSSCR